LHKEITPDDILEWVLWGAELPEQADPTAIFGEPPITLYRGRRFYIEALFWLDGTPAIHQHAFSGAFQVLQGSSLQTSFDFKVERRIGASMLTGQLVTGDIQLLRTGDVQPIYAGNRYIHSLFHLDRPSVTLVLRTIAEVDVRPQYSYARPSLAWDPFLLTPRTSRQIQAIALYRKIEDPKFEERTVRALNRLDSHSAYLVLSSCTLMGETKLSRLLEQIRARHGALVDVWSDVFREGQRDNSIIAKRAKVHDPGQRFFLALMLNAPRRRDVLKLTAAYSPGLDPISSILQWLRQLADVTLKVQVGGVPWEPNLLGLPSFDEASAAKLATWLRSESDERASSDDFIASLRRNTLLRPLFQT
jgi:hypothetical protein